jgi:hypothetical protein
VTAAVQAVTVRGRWFPADVVLPNRPLQWSRCYVLATDTTLHVFRKVGDTAEWEATIRWAGTTLPTVDRDARNGFDIVTDAGLVVVTPGSGCRCGSLGRWSGPSWAATERARR